MSVGTLEEKHWQNGFLFTGKEGHSVQTFLWHDKEKVLFSKKKLIFLYVSEEMFSILKQNTSIKTQRRQTEMKKLWKKMQSFINKNIGRKLLFMLIPTICAILAVSMILMNYIYMDRFVSTIEEDTQYITDTFQMNLDSCMEDVKSFLNQLSMNDSVKYLVSMDMEKPDYPKLLKCEREVKQKFGDIASSETYIQDLIVIGNNGFQYNYMPSLKSEITELDWYQKLSKKKKRGFHYVLPHDVDYYQTGRGPSGSAITIGIPVQGEEASEGFLLCDISLEKVAVLPNTGEKGGMKAYLMDEETGSCYDFQTGEQKTETDNKYFNNIVGKNKGFFTSDKDFIVYSRMKNSPWYIVAVYLYKDIIDSAVTAQRTGFLMLLVSCIIMVVIANMISKSFRKPMDELLTRIHQVEQEDFRTVEIEMKQNQPGEILKIRNSFETMTKRIDDLVHKVYLDEIYRKNMEYENLVNQVNPHFIYNVLQLIQAKAVLSENYEIDDLVVALSRLMRYTMSNRDKIVTIQEECTYIDSYLQLYEQRYSHKFSYEIETEEEIKGYPVLKFILQPVVENCIKHGFKGMKREGHVTVRIYREQDRIIFYVKDNGKGISRERLEELMKHLRDERENNLDSIGLKNTYRRLKLTYEEAAGMEIESEEGNYTKVICYIPYEEKKNV